MTLADIIILVVLGLLIAGIIWYSRRKKKPGSCCGGCSECVHRSCPSDEETPIRETIQHRQEK